MQTTSQFHRQVKCQQHRDLLRQQKMPKILRSSPQGEDAKNLVGTNRLELLTSCLSSKRSNQLSYAPIRLKSNIAYKTLARKVNK
jgi:hypothetical protein